MQKNIKTFKNQKTHMKSDFICNLILQCLFSFSKLKMLCSKPN